MDRYLLAIFAIVSFQSLFLGSYFLAEKTHRLPNLILAALMFVMAIPFGSGLLTYLRILTADERRLITLFVPFLYIYPPIIRFYSLSMIRKVHRLKIRNLLWLLPFALAILSTAYLRLPVVMAGRPLLSSPMDGTELTLGEFILVQGGILFLLIVVGETLRGLKRYKRSLGDYFSDTEAVNLNWLTRLLVLAFVTGTIHFAINMADVLIVDIQGKLFEALELVAASAGLLCILFIAWFSLTRPQIFTLLDVYDSLKGDDPRPQGEMPRYEKQRLGDRIEKNLLADLERHMRDKRPYLENGLTLKQLAESVGMAPHQITMVLNLHRRQNYYAFVNGYRIEEARRKLRSSEDRDETILAIALATGFNSKSTFNTLFKKTTGLTPKEYRDQKL